jgi:hypothetical protein
MWGEEGKECSDNMRGELVHDKGGQGGKEFLRRMLEV